MVDQLDLQILEVIDKAPSIVRSVTEREIEAGVLYPSVTTMDIKRNLLYSVDTKIVEGRLRALESDGYIYYEGKRWWLTHKGIEALGRTASKTSTLPTPFSKPMRKILEETFSRFEFQMQKSLNAEDHLENINEIKKKRLQAETLLSELKQSHEIGLISEEVYKAMTEKINQNLRGLDTQTEEYIQNRRSEILKEIEEIEDKLTMKKMELETLNKMITKKTV